MLLPAIAPTKGREDTTEETEADKSPKIPGAEFTVCRFARYFQNPEFGLGFCKASKISSSTFLTNL